MLTQALRMRCGTVRKRPAMLGKLLGLIVVSIIPALFWIALFALGAAMLGTRIDSVALFAFGASIAMFLILACSPLILSGNGTD